MADILMCPMEQYDHSPQNGSLKGLQLIDPFSYWIQCQSCLDLHKIHEKLKKCVQNHKLVDYTPEIGDCVVVQDIDNMYYRGYISSHLNDEYFTVLLMDKYDELTLPQTDIYPLPSPWENIKQQGHIIRIYGVIPSPLMDFQKPIKWKPKLSNVLYGAREFRLEDSCDIADYTFGSIVMLDGSSEIGIDEKLLEMQYAVRSLDFEKDIMTSWKRNQKNRSDENLCSKVYSPTSFEAHNEQKVNDLHCSVRNDFKISPQRAISIKAQTIGCLLSSESVVEAQKKQSEQDLVQKDNFINQSVCSRSSLSSEYDQGLILGNSSKDTKAMEEECTGKQYYSTGHFSGENNSKGKSSVPQSDDLSSLKKVTKEYNSNSDFPSSKKQEDKREKHNFNNTGRGNIANEYQRKGSEKKISSSFKNSSSSANYSSDGSSQNQLLKFKGQFAPNIKQSSGNRFEKQLSHESFGSKSNNPSVQRVNLDQDRKMFMGKEGSINSSNYKKELHKPNQQFKNEYDHSKWLSEHQVVKSKQGEYFCKHGSQKTRTTHTQKDGTFSNSSRNPEFFQKEIKNDLYVLSKNEETDKNLNSNDNNTQIKIRSRSKSRNRGKDIDCPSKDSNFVNTNSSQKYQSKNISRESTNNHDYTDSCEISVSPDIIKSHEKHTSKKTHMNVNYNSRNSRNSIKEQYSTSTPGHMKLPRGLQKCTSTPKENYSSSHCSENELSPICDNHMQKSRENSEKLRDSIFSTEVPENQDTLKMKELSRKITSNLHSKEHKNSGNSLNSSTMSLDDKQTSVSTSTDSKNTTLLCKGLGRGRLLQIIAESKSKCAPSLAITKPPENVVTENSSNELFSSDENCLSSTVQDEGEAIKNENLCPQNKMILVEHNPVKNMSNDDNLNAEEIRPTIIENDHEDRYFYIEPPKLLKYPLDKSPQTISEESKIEEMKCSDSDNDNEHLLGENIEHESNDTSKLTETNTLQLEKEILSEYSISRLSERMKLSCGIVHGNVKSHPAFSISELKLHDHIFVNMNKKKMSDLTRSEMYAIPVLLQRRNLILIGPPNSGKTLSYIISILSLLLDDNYYQNIKDGNGPRCVFVTSSSQDANNISQYISALCGATLTIITTFGGGLELERKVELTNGCEILVTTPRCWLRLLEHSTVTNLSRLCHVVFDNADTLLKTFLPEILELMSKIKKTVHSRKTECPVDVQLVVVGEKWTPILENCLKVIDSPVLCITSHLEAAFYAQIKPTTYILPEGEKVHKLKDLLHSTPKKLRTVIICRCAAEVKMLRPILELSISDVLVAHEDMSLTLICDVSNKWVRSVSPPILLCSDAIMGELAVTNAQRLIHFSLPDNKSYFSERFGTIKEHFYDRIKYPESAPPDCTVDILVDTGNEDQFPEIVCIMERLSIPIPQNVLEAVKRIHLIKEESKASMMICERILMFGKCWKKERCRRRHIFNKSKDFNPILPQSGFVQVKLLHIHNPSHYSVRILQTKMNSDDPWKDTGRQFSIIGMRLGNYYSRRENRIPHGRVNVGDIVGIEVEPDVLFVRARVNEIVTRDEKLNPVLVNVQFIDCGPIRKYKAIQLLHLPRDMQNVEPEAYDIYLTGLLPLDFDNEWSFAAYLRLQKAIDSLSLNDYEDFFVAKIAFTVGTNMVASSFVCYEWLDQNKHFIQIFSPRDFILESKLAVTNSDHLSTILDLAFEAGLISSYPKEVKDNEDQLLVEEQIQWAHLERDKYFSTFVINAVTPSMFFLKNLKYSDRVSILEKELTNLLNNKIIKPKLMKSDMVCAVKNPVDNNWNRAILLQVLEDSEAEVFCVDYGDTIIVPLSDLSLLPKGFVSKLPFQALECSLVGIVPLDEEWAPECIDCFYWLTGDENNVLKPLYAKVCEVKPKAETTGGRHYQVILVDLSTGKEVILNKELVYKGFANWDLTTKHYLSEPIDIPKDKDVICDDINENENDNGDEIWTPELCNKEQSIEDKECIQDNYKTALADDKYKLFNELIESAKRGELDIQCSRETFVKQFFSLDDQLPLERALPPPPNSQDKTSKDITASADDVIEKDIDNDDNRQLKAIEFPSNELKGADIDNSSITDETGAELHTESDNESTATQDTYLSKVYDSICHPPILWSQNDTHVKIKVDVPDIKLYEVTYSTFKLNFQAQIENKYYWFCLDFFGPICSKTAEFSPKGLYFDIKLEKYVKGVNWPRLTYSNEKCSWIKIDPDSFKKRKELSLVDAYIERGEKLLRENKVPSRGDFENVFALRGPDTDLDIMFGIPNDDSDPEFDDLQSFAVEADYLD